MLRLFATRLALLLGSAALMAPVASAQQSGTTERGKQAEAREASCSRHRSGCNCNETLDRWRRERRERVARDVDRPRDPLDATQGEKRARTVDSARNWRHGAACECGRCDGTRPRGHDRPVVLAPSGSGRLPVILVSDHDSTRYLLDQVSVRKTPRTDGVLAMSDAGGDVLVRSTQGPVVVSDGETATGSVAASSGSLYLHVRADGRLEIRSR